MNTRRRARNQGVPWPANQIQILLVEGNPVDARRLAQMLRAGGATNFRLRRASKLRQAKRHLRKWPGRRSPPRSIAARRAGVGSPGRSVQQAAPNVPLVALSASADDSLAAQALQLGAQDFLVKSEINRGQLARSLSFAIARQQAQSRLRSLSLMDELTGLHNRRGFVSLAEQRLKLTSRQRVRSTLIFMDVDNLKYINDNFRPSRRRLRTAANCWSAARVLSSIRHYRAAWRRRILCSAFRQ